MADALRQTAFARWPPFNPSATFTSQTCDATDDGLAFFFQATSASAITHLGFRYGTRTGTCPTYIIALEGIDASGLPDGTPLGGGSPASATFTPPANTTWNSTFQWVALSNSYTPARGEQLVMTIRYSSGTINGSNNSSFTYSNAHAATQFGMPFPILLTAGTWAKQSTSGSLFGYRTASERYGFVFATLYTTTINTSGNRQAMKFNLPAGHGDTFQLVGAMMNITTPAAAASMLFGLWNAAGTALQDVTIDSDNFQANSTTKNIEIFFDESSLATLDFGTDYYLGIEVVSSAAIGLSGVNLTDADDRQAWPNGANRTYSLWNGSSWADTTTILPQVMPIFADITEPSGGGSRGVVIGG